MSHLHPKARAGLLGPNRARIPAGPPGRPHICSLNTFIWANAQRCPVPLLLTSSQQHALCLPTQLCQHRLTFSPQSSTPSIHTHSSIAWWSLRTWVFNRKLNRNYFLDIWVFELCRTNMLFQLTPEIWEHSAATYKRDISPVRASQEDQFCLQPLKWQPSTTGKHLLDWGTDCLWEPMWRKQKTKFFFKWEPLMLLNRWRYYVHSHMYLCACATCVHNTSPEENNREKWFFNIFFPLWSNR